MDLLEPDELEQIVNEMEVDYIQNSVGFRPVIVKPENIALLKQLIKPIIKIKACGGLDDTAKALAIIKAGADRIGTSSGIQLINDTAILR